MVIGVIKLGREKLEGCFKKKKLKRDFNMKKLNNEFSTKLFENCFVKFNLLTYVIKCLKRIDSDKPVS